jgi:hypothetical protein
MKNRSVIEIMVLTFTFVVSFGIMATGALVAIVEIRDPTADTSGLVRALVTIITLILGSLLGLLAAKSSVGTELGKSPEGVDWTKQTGDLYKRPGDE